MSGEQVKEFREVVEFGQAGMLDIGVSLKLPCDMEGNVYCPCADCQCGGNITFE